MMMRADEEYTAASEGCSMNELLACFGSSDISACMAACNGDENTNPEDEDEVKEGTLTVTMGDALADGTSIPAVATVSFGNIKFAADEDITVKSISVKRQGLGNKSGISKVWLEKDGVRISGKASLSTDETTTISLTTPLTVKAGKNETLDLVVAISDVAGAEHQFAVTEVESSAQKVNLKNVKTPTLRTTTYTVSDVVIAAKGTNLATKANEENIELGQFSVESDGGNAERDVTLKMIKVRQTATTNKADLENLADIALYLDNEKVSKKASIDGDYVVFTLDEVLTPAKTYTFYIRGNVNYVENAAGDYYRFTIKSAEDVTAIETNNEFRTSVNKPTFTAIDLKQYKVEGTDIMLSKDTELSLSQNVAPGSEGVTLVKGQVITNETITLENLNTASFKLHIAGATSDSKVSETVKKLTLKIGNQTITWLPKDTDVVNGAGKIDLQPVFEGLFTVSKKATLEITADLNKNAKDAATVEVDDLDLSMFEEVLYVANNENAASNAIGVLPTATLTVKASTLNLSRTDGLSAQTIVPGASDKLLFAGKLSTTSNKVTVSSIKFDLGAVAAFDNKLQLSFYIDGTLVATTTLRNSNAVLNKTLNVEKGKDIEVKVYGTFNSNIAAASTATPAIVVVDAVDANGVDLAALPTTNAASITMAANGSATIAKNSSAKADAIYAAGTENIELGKFNITAKNDTLRLTDLYLDNKGTAKLALRISNPTLVIGENTYNGTIRTNGSDYIAFEGISEDVVPTEDLIATVYATINNVEQSTDLFTFACYDDDDAYIAGTSNSETEEDCAAANHYWGVKTYVNGIQLQTTNVGEQAAGTTNGIRLVSKSNGNVVPVDATVVVANNYGLFRGIPTVALTDDVATSNKVMKFSVTANGNKVTLEGINIESVGIDGDAKFTLKVGNTVVATTAVLTDAKGWLMLDNSYEISKGTSVEFTLEISDYTPDTISTVALANREVRVTDILWGDIYTDNTAKLFNLNRPVEAITSLVTTYKN